MTNNNQPIKITKVWNSLIFSRRLAITAIVLMLANVVSLYLFKTSTRTVLIIMGISLFMVVVAGILEFVAYHLLRSIGEIK